MFIDLSHIDIKELQGTKIPKVEVFCIHEFYGLRGIYNYVLSA